MPGQVPPLDDESSQLLAYIEQQRAAVRLAAYGLTDEQARLRSAVSELTIGGLVKHVASVERSWLALVEQRAAESDGETDYLDSHVLRPDETLADALAALEATARKTESIIAGINDLSRPVPVPKGVPWYPDDIDSWSVRWVLLHLVEEIARHAGHADILREEIDGATAMPLMAAAEGWPATPWVQPWQAPGSETSSSVRQPAESGAFGT